MIRTVIIDDEDHVRENLKQILAANFPGIDVVGEGSSVASAVQAIQQHKPDLVLLDVDLSDGSGFNVLESLEEINFAVIFVTAYQHYAIKAIRYNALDYILKPVNVAELGVAIGKVTPTNKLNYITREELKSILADLPKKDEDKKLVIRSNDMITYVKVMDIVRCEADGNYTTLYLISGKKIIASKPLREYDSLLPDSIFFRVHQSHLINLHFVEQFSKIDGGVIEMVGANNIPIARRRKAEFLDKLDQIAS